MAQPQSIKAPMLDDDSKQQGRWLYAIPIVAILISHYFVDVYSSLIPPLVGVVENEFSMRPAWSAVLLGVGSISSGLAQPVFAWLSDRWNTRWFGAIGVLMGTVGITLIGFSTSVSMLFVVYSLGMIGIGMFHPIAASTIGRLAGPKRGLAISCFFVFGMAGFFTGSLVGPPMATGSGSLRSLSYLIVPGLIMVVVLQLSIGKVQHKKVTKKHELTSMSQYDWWSIIVLYLASVCRFLVNLALVYLLVRWMEQYVAELHPDWTREKVADVSAPMAGRANAVMILGQGIGGLLAGALIRAGREKLPLVWTPILFSPAFLAIAMLEPGAAGYAACFFAGAGFAAMTPVSVSVGQHLMPFHTSVASGIMLGAAWAAASTGPRIAEALIKQFNIETALFACCGTLIASGLIASLLNKQSMLDGANLDKATAE